MRFCSRTFFPLPLTGRTCGETCGAKPPFRIIYRPKLNIIPYPIHPLRPSLRLLFYDSNRYNLPEKTLIDRRRLEREVWRCLHSDDDVTEIWTANKERPCDCQPTGSTNTRPDRRRRCFGITTNATDGKNKYGIERNTTKTPPAIG